MGLRLLPDISRDEWNGIVVGFRDQNFYQSWEWGEARRAMGWQVRRFVFERQGRIAAAAQALLREIPLIPCGLLRVRGGPLVLGPYGEEMAALRGILAGMSEGFGGAVMRISPHHLSGNGLEAILTACGLERPRGQPPQQTFWVDLKSDLEVLRKQLSPSWRRNLSKAEQKEGLTIRPVASMEDCQRFFALHSEMVQRKGFHDHLTWDLLRGLWRVSSASSGVLGFLAVSGEEVVAGRILGFIGQEVMDLFAVTTLRGREVFASYQLLWEVIKAAKQRGFSRLDLGGADAMGNRGVFDFKQGVGGELVEFVGHWNFCRWRPFRWLFDTVIEPRL
jgi:lipid II:glycine glycyltransferase (peptidoglycan interpeptide bridge formation enzyme)